MRSTRQRNEAGYVAIMISIMLPTLFLGLAAVGVDSARWYLEMERVQKAADAAALAGVPFLPQDLTSARARALAVAKRNGYDDASADVEVTAVRGDRDSQLRITITSRIDNQFGQMIGVGHATIGRSAVADYSGPAPMGSPCNTFSNEPSAGTPTTTGANAVPVNERVGPTGSAQAPEPNNFENCTSNPKFWATMEGPQTYKTWGDRYATRRCSPAVFEENCDSDTNTEYNELGYFWVVKVEPEAVHTSIDVQLYDPAFVPTGQACESLSSSVGNGANQWRNNMNPYVTTDGEARYSRGLHDSSTGASYCPGDFFIPNYPAYGIYGDEADPQTTSFVLREQTDSQNPMEGAPISGCTKQFAGMSSTPTPRTLRLGDSQYNRHLARVFHNWYSLCTFTPDRPGDYYIQVRTNVSAAGLSPTQTNSRPKIIYSGNASAAAATANKTTGYGVNSFAIRAVTDTGKETSVAVSAFDRMPIYANGDSTTSTFNLIRVLPAAAGQFISFSFYDVSDVGDPNAAGTVSVIPPADATGTIETDPFPGSCRAVGAGAGSSGQVLGSDCAAEVSNAANNGKVETMSIPIPGDYECDYESLGGCWYEVVVDLSDTVNDITTWDAQIVGDPVRLIE